MNGVESLLWAVGGLFVGVIAGALGQGVVDGVRRWARRRNWVKRGFQVRFVQKQGANICNVMTEETPEGNPERWVYRVWLLFDLWTNRETQLGSIELRYDWESDPYEQRFWCGVEELETDEHHRLRGPVALTAGSPTRLKIGRRFLTLEEMYGDRDTYRDVTLDCEVSTAEFGFEHLTITGRLQPGGVITDVRTRLRPDDELARDARRKKAP